MIIQVNSFYLFNPLKKSIRSQLFKSYHNLRSNKVYVKLLRKISEANINTIFPKDVTLYNREWISKDKLIFSFYVQSISELTSILKASVAPGSFFTAQADAIPNYKTAVVSPFKFVLKTSELGKSFSEVKEWFPDPTVLRYSEARAGHYIISPLMDLDICRQLFFMNRTTLNPELFIERYYFPLLGPDGCSMLSPCLLQIENIPPFFIPHSELYRMVPFKFTVLNTPSAGPSKIILRPHSAESYKKLLSATILYLDHILEIKPYYYKLDKPIKQYNINDFSLAVNDQLIDEITNPKKTQYLINPQRAKNSSSVINFKTSADIDKYIYVDRKLSTPRYSIETTPNIENLISNEILIKNVSNIKKEQELSNLLPGVNYSSFLIKEQLSTNTSYILITPSSLEDYTRLCDLSTSKNIDINLNKRERFEFINPYQVEMTFSKTVPTGTEIADFLNPYKPLDIFHKDKSAWVLFKNPEEVNKVLFLNGKNISQSNKIIIKRGSIKINKNFSATDFGKLEIADRLTLTNDYVQIMAVCNGRKFEKTSSTVVFYFGSLADLIHCYTKLICDGGYNFLNFIPMQITPKEVETKINFKNSQDIPLFEQLSKDFNINITSNTTEQTKDLSVSINCYSPTQWMQFLPIQNNITYKLAQSLTFDVDVGKEFLYSTNIEPKYTTEII